MPTAPTDNRPEHTDDLDDSIHDGDLSYVLLAVHGLDRIAAVPRALAALGTLLDVLRDDEGGPTRPPVTVTDAGAGVFSVKQPFTQPELAHHLKTTQARYDRGHELYQEYLDLLGDDGAGHPGDLAEFAQKYRHQWSYYLRREGIDAPKHGAE
ncbi:hypothetical protein SEA_ALI17_43 [Gordonia phage Ali17]|uniref:Uncharacterized protein n=1 Tax=Gordonia phage Ali17 TaxID=2301561 RepID=A0A385DPV5_9CAUD|nr:hypothetical protein J1772_gp43 [Gordonia phage Ali17]AXQ60659.1 hypothetical protein SEA_ALI17_43 [Gordonia phage Ali17]QXN73264.1 hypothetical protein SEA_HANS_47 [Gordonia phage Hans]